MYPLLSPDLQYVYGNDGPSQAYADSLMHLPQQVQFQACLTGNTYAGINAMHLSVYPTTQQLDVCCLLA